MSKVKIQLLTCLHIGSGETLLNGNDFVVGKDGDGYDVVGIIDPAKIAQIIGIDKVRSWAAEVELGTSTDTIVRRYSPKSTIDEYSKRIIDSGGIRFQRQDTLKEFIHDGFGRPYIPGTSIKGAIRTAVLATMVAGRPELQAKITVKPGKLSAKSIENEVFGTNSNSDCLRFLRVGDAYFGDNYESVLRMVNINERPSQGYWDTSKPQLIEVLQNDDESTFELVLNEKMSSFVKDKDRNGEIHTLPECISTYAKLFSTINLHSLKLVDEDIKYWESRALDDDSRKVDEYLSAMNGIRSEILKCEDGKSCVLRIGHGCGWRFTTGAWTENYSNFKTEVVQAARPKNDRYRQFDFPKTRRVSHKCELLGFTKLTLL